MHDGTDLSQLFIFCVAERFSIRLTARIWVADGINPYEDFTELALRHIVQLRGINLDAYLSGKSEEEKSCGLTTGKVKGEFFHIFTTFISSSTVARSRKKRWLSTLL